MGKQLLDGERGTIFWMDPDDLVVVGVDTPHKSTDEHPLYDPRILLPIDDDLVTNILDVGVKQTVTCTVLVEKGENVAYVVDGRRRVLHARAAKKRAIKNGEKDAVPLVPCLAEKNMKSDVIDIVSVGLNELRVDDPVMVKASKAQKLIQRVKNPARVAAAFGVTTQTISMWCDLIGLAPAIHKAIDAHQITPSAAVKLKGLSHEDQVAELKTLLESGVKPTAAEVGARTTKKRKNGGDDGARAPKKRVLSKILTVGKEDLPDLFLKGIAYATLGTDPRISGFADIVKQASETKKSKKADARA